MNELIKKLREVLASNFALYLKTQMFHWNIEGPNFNDYHAFWATVYTDLYEQNDLIAEYIRQANEYAPGSLDVYKQLSVIDDEDGFPKSVEMFNKFLSNNDSMITLYNQLYELAEKNEEYQISDFCAQRLAAHKKHAWMVRSILKD
jgi:starvation-inducible DNA-binding protein